jgi:hypothetical protein
MISHPPKKMSLKKDFRPSIRQKAAAPALDVADRPYRSRFASQLLSYLGDVIPR